MTDSRATKTIARQLTPLFLSIFVFLVLAIGLFTVSQLTLSQAFMSSGNQALPSAEKQLSKIIAIDKALKTVEAIQKKLGHEDVAALHGELLLQLNSIDLSQTDLTAIRSYDETELARLATNIERNISIGERADIALTGSLQQIQLLLTELNRDTVADTEQQLNLLKTVEQLSSLQKRLNQLQFQVSQIATFGIETYQEDSKAAMAEAESLSAQIATSMINPEQQSQLSGSLNELLNIFLRRDALIGKWQGTKRLYNEYQQLVTVLHTQLSANRETALSQAELIAEQSNQKLALPMLGQQVTQEQLRSSLLIGASILFGIAALLIARLYHLFSNKIKQTITDIDTRLAGRKGANVEQSLEFSVVENAISSAFTNAYAEQDVRALEAAHQAQLDMIGEVENTFAWRIADGNLEISSPNQVKAFLRAGEYELPQPKHSDFVRVFGKETVKALLQYARSAKVDRVLQKCVVKLADGQFLNVAIRYESNQWLGTFSSHSEIAEKDGEIATLTQQLNDQQQSALVSIEHDHETLSQMLVQAMLQSQNAAMVSGVSSQPVYRQLERVFDWLRQQQIIAQLGQAKRQRELGDVDIRQTIYAAVYNLTVEAQLRHNKVRLAIDDRMADYVNTDIRLFSRLFTAFSRLLLKEQFKHELVLSVGVVDQNPGQQTLVVSGEVFTNSDRKPLPKHLSRIASGKSSSYQSRTEIYFQALLNALHGKGLAISQTGQGFEAHFQLPVSVTSLASPHDRSNELMHKHVLVISGDDNNRKILARYISQAKADCETLSKADYFAKDYSLASISRRKLDCVVLGSDMLSQIETVQQHIDTLPAAKQPALVALQPALGASIEKDGLFSMTDTPVCGKQLIDEIVTTVNNRYQGKTAVEAAQFSDYNHIATHVELLLAVKNVAEQQVLWRLLNWLGFRVTVVANPQSMLKHWQTGRYLVLMNAFDTSPFVPMLAGKSISRGVFHFAEDDVFELNEEQIELGKHWHFGRVPHANDVQALIKLLSPWLKEKRDVETTFANTSHKAEPQVVPSLPSDSFKDSLSFEQMADALPAAFDMNEYVKNQGSPELAVFMLEEYIDTLKEKAGILIELIEAQAHEDVQLAINEINLVANILSAPGLIQLGSQLEQALLNNSYDHMMRLVEQVKTEISVVKTFADAI
ncbi:hypothetical protein ACFSJY_04580 [Thalassotalea euphylliae]|uniref:hypothetical protein n=1 Tax=Thalassotalea euphylliae TaxID=1655234 RepID=UPI00362DB885